MNEHIMFMTLGHCRTCTLWHHDKTCQVNRLCRNSTFLKRINLPRTKRIAEQRWTASPVGKYKVKQRLDNVELQCWKRNSILLKRINVEIWRCFNVEIWCWNITLKYDVVSTLKSDVVSTLKSDVVSTLKSNVVATLKSDVVSTLKFDVVSTLKSYVVATLKSDVVSTLKFDVVSMLKYDVDSTLRWKQFVILSHLLWIVRRGIRQKESLLSTQSSPRVHTLVLATAWELYLHKYMVYIAIGLKIHHTQIINWSLGMF